MSCAEIQPELVAFHFGELQGEPRQEVERHLLACQGCLEDYLELKRAVETSSEELAPSAAAQQRLRQAVAAELQPEAVPAPAVSAPWSWWERPAALLFASAAVVAALFFVQIIGTSEGTMPYSLTRQDRAADSR